MCVFAGTTALSVAQKQRAPPCSPQDRTLRYILNNRDCATPVIQNSALRLAVVFCGGQHRLRGGEAGDRDAEGAA